MHNEVLRCDGVFGELVLRERASKPGEPAGLVMELISNGVFLMDSGDTSTERALADVGVRGVKGNNLEVLVGGLGLGFTAEQAAAMPTVCAVDVVEIEPELVRYFDSPASYLPQLQAEAKVKSHIASIHHWVVDCAARDKQYDVVLLDVDNGPSFLTSESNSILYTTPLLAMLAEITSSRGKVTFWSAQPEPELVQRLSGMFAVVREEKLTVRRGNRDFDYYLQQAAHTNIVT